MKKIPLTFIIPSILCVLLFLTSCGNDSRNQMQQAPQAMPFPVVTVPSETVTAYSTYPTSLEGIVDSEVRAKTSGYITDVLVDAGQKVKKGQTLFKLETQSLSQDAAAAKANVAAAQVEVDKLKPLVEKNIISNVQLETAKAKLAQAQSGYNSIAANIGYSTIKSPVDGFVGAINFREGALVSPTSQVPMTTVADIEKIYAFFSMNEKEYLSFIQNTEGKTLEDKIKNLPKVRLILANGSQYGEEGTIQTINPQVDPATGTVSFRAVFDNSAHILSSGYSGKIQLPKTYTDATVVPAMSTYERQGVTYVYKVQGDTLATSASINILDKVDNLIIVKDGIVPGDKIVAKGVGKLRDQTPIIAQRVDFDSIAKGLDKVFK
ncbi:efflux RND transporter periplasmic adaptor subunit [Aequorivita sp. H23M31]|uniref:Efflux RND transporter periplasmic adaptor subunit n=1 Tax=Aequorivita ciconiae TaxID=2494375 RepID=A0A410G548_9FLAO|nr:efflux RND transporter periplasmic adaptor subunit [Aequorivita sp. H23M31]QAA82408.1 efflux RND transporter periplasmic adaptor subunit [Aequorivita sp. H23M31]